MITVKNTQPGPRGINTKQGPVLLQPGEQRELDVHPDEVKVSKATGWFDFGGHSSSKEEEEENDFSKMTVAELKDHLANKGVELNGDEKKADLVELAEAQEG